MDNENKSTEEEGGVKVYDRPAKADRPLSAYVIGIAIVIAIILIAVFALGGFSALF